MGQRKEKRELAFYQEIFDTDKKASCIINSRSRIHI